MMAVDIAATLYAVGCVGLILFQVALIAGAPWGAYTQGGRVSGPLDTAGRALAAGSVGMLAFMAVAVLNAGGVISVGWPIWTGWLAVGVSALTVMANLATRSAVERNLWAPIALIQLALVCWVMIMRQGA